MSRKRLEAAILAGHNMCVGDYALAKDFAPQYNQFLDTKQIHLPFDRWGIYSLQYNPNGDGLVVGFGNGGICAINHLDDSAVVKEITRGHQRGLAVMSLKYHVCSGDNYLLSAGASGVINLWDLERNAGEEPMVSLFEEENEISALDICCDGTFFATAGKDRHIRLYDANNMKLFHTIIAPDVITMDDINTHTGHTQRIFALKFHPEENHLFLTAGWDNCVKLWDKRMARSAKKSIPGSHVCGAGLDVTGNKILTGSWLAKNALQLWDLRAGVLDRNIAYPRNKKVEGEFLYCAKFSSSNVILAGGSGTNNACALSLTSDKVLGTINSKKPVLAIDSCNVSKQVAVAGIGGNLQIAAFA